jgi:hypothetical protein
VGSMQRKTILPAALLTVGIFFGLGVTAALPLCLVSCVLCPYWTCGDNC